MSGILELLNHLLQAALAEQRAGGPVTVRSVELDPDGGRLIARIDHPAVQGEVVLKLHIEPPSGHRQTLRLSLEQCPETLHPALEAFRGVLEKIRIRVELDFTP